MAMPGTLETEIAIVGAGAAGSLLAAKLAAAGRQVTLFERGPAWRTEDMISSQLWARRLKWGGPPVGSGQPPTLSHNLGFGWGLGGAALHHYGTWPRMHPETFQLATVFGPVAGLDWPFAYDTLRPFYDWIQDEVGVSGDEAQEPWRGAGDPYPMPPLPTLRHGLTLKPGFERLGLPVAPLPAAINTVERNGRPGCLYDGWCDAGCPIGALANPLVTHIEQARRAGAAFSTMTTVLRLDASADGRRIETMRVRGADGQERTVRARLFILAASVVQNPRLMLLSTGAKHPDGLANRNGLVGAYVSIESGANVYGIFPEPTENHEGVSAGQLMHRQSYRGKDRPYGGYQWQIAPAMKPNDIFGVAFTRPDLFGGRLARFLEGDGKRLGSIIGFAADNPQPTDRVVLDSTKTDADGLPGAAVRYARSETSLALFQHTVDEGHRVMKAAGAKEVWNAPLLPGHITGGTIMGSDPAASVTDSYGRTHEIANLVLAGGGLIPANGGTSPTYTIYALALRTAEHIAAHWSDYAAP